MDNTVVKQIIVLICILYQYTATYWLLRKSLEGPLPEKKGIYAIIGLYTSFIICQLIVSDIICLFIAYLAFLTIFWLINYKRAVTRYGVKVWRSWLLALAIPIIILVILFVW